MQRCQSIGLAPLAYSGREDLAPGLRMAPFDRYVIPFRVPGDVVRIERVLHGARDLPALNRNFTVSAPSSVVRVSQIAPATVAGRLPPPGADLRR